MADSFNGITIVVSNETTPRTVKADVSIRHMPGGSNTYIDNPGPNLVELDLVLFFQYGSDALAFEAQLGQVGTLSIYEGVWTALLSSLTRSNKNIGANQETTLQAVFTLL